MTFIGLHVCHIALVAMLFRGPDVDWAYGLIVSGLLLVCAIVVVTAPQLLKTPVATMLYLVAVAVGLYWLGLTPGLEWFLPALFLKLLIGHAAPLQRL
ncbi:MAG: hypothetical protein AAGE03_02820 [Pseudomonadota bacterium]